jgi:hypothetical protein
MQPGVVEGGAAEQTSPQPPQFALSICKSVQTPEQHASPEAQGGLQGGPDVELPTPPLLLDDPMLVAPDDEDGEPELAPAVPEDGALLLAAPDAELSPLAVDDDVAEPDTGEAPASPSVAVAEKQAS